MNSFFSRLYCHLRMRSVFWNGSAKHCRRKYELPSRWLTMYLSGCILNVNLIARTSPLPNWEWRERHSLCRWSWHSRCGSQENRLQKHGQTVPEEGLLCAVLMNELIVCVCVYTHTYIHIYCTVNIMTKAFMHLYYYICAQFYKSHGNS